MQVGKEAVFNVKRSAGMTDVSMFYAVSNVKDVLFDGHIDISHWISFRLIYYGARFVFTPYFKIIDIDFYDRHIKFQADLVSSTDYLNMQASTYKIDDF